MDDMDYRFYVLAEIAYKKANPDIKEEDLYPIDWYSYNNYKLKSEIIAEAIDNKVLVKDTQKYMELNERIRNAN